MEVTGGKASNDNGRSEASRAMARIKRRLGERTWQEKLEAADLGDTRLLEELSAALRAMKTEYYHGVPVAECEDNTNRQRALELLADILGKRKAAVELMGMLGVKGYIGVSPEDWDDSLVVTEPAIADDAAPPQKG
jgi:hypothetical protein